MDINGILNQLREERAQLEEAILALQRLQLGGGKRRGRPPAWMKALKADSIGPDAPKRRGRPPGSKNKAVAA